MKTLSASFGLLAIAFSFAATTALAEPSILNFTDVCHAKRVVWTTKYQNLVRAYFAKVRPEIKAELEQDKATIEAINQSLSDKEKRRLLTLTTPEGRKARHKDEATILKALAAATRKALEQQVLKKYQNTDACKDDGIGNKLICEETIYENSSKAEVTCGCANSIAWVGNLDVNAFISLDSDSLIEFYYPGTGGEVAGVDQPDTNFRITQNTRKTEAMINAYSDIKPLGARPERAIRLTIQDKAQTPGSEEHDLTPNQAVKFAVDREMRLDKECRNEVLNLVNRDLDKVWDGTSAGLKGAPVAKPALSQQPLIPNAPAKTDAN